MLPRRRQRVVAGVVAFVLFIAAGAFAWNALSPTRTGVVGDGAGSTTEPGQGDLVVTLRAPTEPSTETDLHLPTAVFRLGEQATEIPTQGMTGWPDIPADTFTAPLYNLGFTVPAGTRLVVQGDATAASASIRNGIPADSPAQQFDLSEGFAILPLEPGQYVIDMTGAWDEGTATFTALFDVVSAGDAAVLTFDEQDPATPRLSFTVGGATFPAILGTHSWTFDNGSGFADAATPSFTDADMVQVASGTPLLLQDPPPTVSIMANQGEVINWGPKFDLSASRAFDLPKGRYLVIVDAQWSDAQAQFWLPIEIVDRQVPTSAVVTNGSHAPVPRSVSEGCPVVAGALTTDATAVQVGEKVTFSGPIYHRMEDGSFFLSPTEDYQAWWGIALDAYSDLGTGPFTIAKGDEIKIPASGPRMLGNYRPNGACGFDIALVVPNVEPGSYDVTVISADVEGYAAYGTVTIEVLPPT